jgi:hypothetical protein
LGTWQTHPTLGKTKLKLKTPQYKGLKKLTQEDLCIHITENKRLNKTIFVNNYQVS